MDETTLQERISQLSAPLAPRPTGETPELPRQDGIRAVVFDVYGTLLISASGDISLASEGAQGAAAYEAILAADLPPVADGAEIAERLKTQITAAHAASASATPEVEIREIWRQLLADEDLQLDDQQLAELAIQYECRVNPVWPMPGMTEVLEHLAGSGRVLGIVSNAQFFTPLAMQALSGRSLEELGFASELCIWSFVHREAKPGQYLYRRSADSLAARGIEPREVLYVGNDMLNDIWPAGQLGFRTALFAGDARSLRRRDGDPRVAAVAPDAVITELKQLLYILG